jgi:hypothetical protein
MDLIKFLIITFCLFNNQGEGEFNCRGNYFKIRYPRLENGSEHKQSYHEGYFTTILYEDSSYLLIHCGSMVNRPFFKGDDLILLDSLKIEDRIIRTGYKMNTDLSWREDFYFNRNITIGYFNVKKKDLESFNSSLCNVIFNP